MSTDIFSTFRTLRDQIMEAEFSHMNDCQRQAVLHTKGPLLVLAGAGSGKTTVLVNRIACILKYGNAYKSSVCPDTIGDEDIAYLKKCLLNKEFEGEKLRNILSVNPPPAWSILAITFTNKAANEMKDRLEKILGSKSDEIWACTFHSACSRILRRDIDKLNMGYTRSFTIYDTDDTIKVLRECCKEVAGDDRSFVTKTALPAISRAKEKNLDPAAFEAAAANDFRLKKLSSVYYKYQEALMKANALDFDDMLRLTVLLFDRRPDILEFYQRRFRYILVDEYQDTNPIQYRLVSQLAARHENLCVVGDDDQSIYRFRGATIENILSFEQQFKNAKVVKLEQNYRSTSIILDAANAVIANNKGRKSKKLWTNNQKGNRISVCRFDDEQSESQYIAECVLKNVREGLKFSDQAILYRMNAQSGSIEKAFVRNGIPYRIIGGFRFYERLEVKDIISYLCVINNPEDNLHFIRIVNSPKRSIGNATISAAQEIADKTGKTLYDVFLHCEDYSYFSKKISRIQSLMAFFEDMQAQKDKTPLHELIKQVIEKSGYLAALQNENSNEAKERIENLSTLISNAADYEKLSDEPTLQGFLEEAALMSDIDNYDGDTDTVIMMTIHSAKGLEFPVVYITGMEEGIFPNQSTAAFPDELEEERRLAYVGITRAKQSLYFSYAGVRMLFGSTVYNKPSRFLSEIPDELKNETEKRSRFEKQQIHPMPVTGFKQPQKPGVSQQNHTDVSFDPGDMVWHKTFGKGMVLSVKPMGGDILLEIAFEKFGTKKLMANFAKLKKE